MRTDDGYIIYQCLNGDPEAFGVLVDRYKEGIYAYTYAKLQDWRDAQDTTQEVFIQAYRKLHTLKRWDSFGGWLYRIASNLCKNWQIKTSKRPDREFIEDQDSEIIDKPSLNSYHENEMIQSVHDALSSLSDTYREVLTLYYFGGMDSNKIAEMLNTSPTAIRLRLSRAREQLREEIFSMMSATYQQQKLKAGFTFRIIEAIKRIKINPISQTKGIPWGVSLVLGMIAIVIGLNPQLFTLELFNSQMNLPFLVESKVLDIGDMPVSVLKTAKSPLMSAQQGNSNGINPENMNAFFMAPQAVGEWEKKADMPTARCGACSSTVNGKIYVFGGANSLTDGFSVVEEYNPVTDIWTRKKDMKALRGFSSASAVNGKIYVISGATPGPIAIPMVEEYDPTTDTWTRKAEIPTARFTHSSSVANGKIYAIGGLTNGAVDLASVEEYDPKTDKWTKKSDMSTARQGVATCEVNGKIYAIGGWNANNGVLASVEEYDPATDTWTKKANMLTPRNTSVACSIDGMIYVIGGNNNWNANGTLGLSSVEIYDPITDKWTKKEDIPTPRQQFCASVVDGHIYAFGGAEKFLGWIFPVAPVISNVEAYDTGFYSPIISNVKANDKISTKWGEAKR